MGRMKKSRGNNYMKNKAARAATSKDRTEEDVSDGMDDEVDKFHKNREKIPLEESDSEEEEIENPVFDLKGSDNEEDEDEEDDEDLPDEQLNSMAAKIEKQAKLLRQRRGIIDDEDDEEEDSEKEKDDWGKRKRNYYAADNADFELLSSDEEGPALEEAEARRLQQKAAQSLRPEDFEQDDMDDEADDTFEKLVEQNDQTVKTKSKLSSDVPIEKVQKDLNSLSKDEKLQVIMSNAPELVGLLSELKSAFHELQHKVHPLLKKIDSGNFVSKEGKMYAEVKHMLLLSYCQSIVFYLLLKAEGRSVCDHPVIAKLVEIRTLLEKVRLVDKKVEHQVEKLMLLDISKLPQLEEDSSKLQKDKTDSVSVVLEKQQTNDQSAAPKKLEDFIGEESQNMLREMERLEEKAKRDRLLEQTRVTENKVTRSGKRNAGFLADLEDDLGDVNSDLQPKNISQVIAEAGKRQKKPKIVSGDVDLPVKEDIGERRRKREMQKPSQEETPVEQADAEEAKKQFEDEFYQEAKKIKLAKEAAKAERQSRRPAITPEPEDGDRKRLITSEMEKNRGLTPYRKKASKNPRKKYKTKHGKAVIRRKGQVRDIRVQAGPYGGEPTGIRTNLSRSVRLS